MSVERKHAGRAVAVAASVLLLVVGAVLVLTQLGSSDRPPQPPKVAATAAAGASNPAPAPTGQSSATAAAPRSSAAGPVLWPRSVPTKVVIPRIKVTSSLITLGVNKNDEMQVPSGANYDRVGWYTGSPSPGEAGPAVLAGHVDGKSGPSIFYRLGSLRAGDRVQVTRGDGRTVTYAVYRAERYAKDAFPTAAVYGNTDDAQLRLITCSGDINPADGHYRDNTVIYARRVA